MSTQNTPPRPNRGEVWLLDMEPTRGSELRKQRPAVVISSDRMGRLPLRTIVPFTDWKDRYANYPWMVRVDPSASTGLSKTSSADCIQIRGVDLGRFIKRLGALDSGTLSRIAAAIAATVEYLPSDPSYPT